ncbi:MAG: hypothetical protein BGO69_05475 [Bacteroidetes bacterium 46-16]|nr:MAG: hypothetical protein BGO69_05475 [Bacteroidetes bacterium 46-16]
MLVFGTELHVITFLIIVLELVFFIYQSIHYLSRRSDKNRLYYLILLYLLIQYNLISGLLPDKKIPINIEVQNVIAFAVAFIMGMYFPYYFYKVYGLAKLKFYAYGGSLLFLLVPFFICFLVPYYLTDNLELSRRLAVTIPFLYALSFLYSLTKAIRARNRESDDPEFRKEIFGVYLAVTFFIMLPIIAFFEVQLNTLLRPVLHFHNGSQVVEAITTNSGMLVMTVLFIRRSVRQSILEYNKLQESEKRLQGINEELTIKVKERTRELELANEQRTNAFINLAHETKTPLTLINNSLDDYIAHFGENEELKLIKRSIEKLNNDIVNFFDMERVSKGMEIYNHHQVSDFSAILSDIVALFKKYSDTKSISLTAYIQPDIYIEADPTALTRIVNNLIENAIKYTDPNGDITVRLVENEGEIKLEVEDTGIGIPPMVHEKIFDPYYQLNREKSNLQGMGLGLPIVRKVIQSLDGTIKIDSNPALKKGTIVIVMLKKGCLSKGPVTNYIPKVETGLYDPDKIIPSDLAYHKDKRTILIVEDNKAMISFLYKRLNVNYNISYALNGAEALKKLQESEALPDLILSDVMMDKMDGFTFVKILSANDRYNHIPIIFVTAKTALMDKLRGLKLGAIDFLSKPFSIEELSHKIETVIDTLVRQQKAILSRTIASLNHANQLEGTSYITSKFDENCRRLQLTARESEIVQLIAKGKSYKQIANKLFIAENTVSKHVQNIFEKTGVSNKVELINLLTV